MLTRRTIAHAPQTEQLGQALQKLQGPCIGCVDCQGVCQALLDTISVPQVILRDRAV